MLTSGVNRVPFNLYRSATYTAAEIWGCTTQMSMSSLFLGLLAVGTNTQTYPMYARIAAADLAGIPMTGNADTPYATAFTGAGMILYSSASVIVLNCNVNAQTAQFTFAVRANIVNDCVIGPTPLSFGTKGMLTASTRAMGSPGVKCTNASSYRIALNNGMHFDATGTGFTQTIPIYGRVPGQRTPTPGDYTDKVTATIYF